MAHGFFLMRGLDIVSLTLALSMTVAIGSGILLKFGSRKVKLYNVQLAHEHSRAADEGRRLTRPLRTRVM
jgi:hypothetical protein